MTVFQIPETNTKGFMNLLLKENTFDVFDVRTAEISTFAKFEISGAFINDAPVGVKDNQESKEAENQGKSIVDANAAKPAERPLKQWCRWSELRPYIFNIIKGGSRPKSFKVVLSMPSEKLEYVHKNAGALFLNVIYENNSLVCVAATGQKTFSMDKTLDSAWDEYLKEFFAANRVIYGLE